MSRINALEFLQAVSRPDIQATRQFPRTTPIATAQVARSVQVQLSVTFPSSISSFGEPVMRLPPVSPSDLSPEQHPLYDDMRKGIETNFKGFEAINSDGALIGPWNPWLRFSRFGGPIWELVKALSISPTLPRPVREVAILVTGVSTPPTSYTLTSSPRRHVGCRTRKSRPSWPGSAPQT
jgi:hypothetical protein